MKQSVQIIIIAAHATVQIMRLRDDKSIAKTLDQRFTEMFCYPVYSLCKNIIEPRQCEVLKLTIDLTHLTFRLRYIIIENFSYL